MQCSLSLKELISQDGRVWAREKEALVWLEEIVEFHRWSGIEL